MPKLCMSTVQKPRIGIIFVHHGGVMISGEQLMWLCFNINIMGILKRKIGFYVEVLVIFVLLKICLGNPGSSI